MDILPLHVFSTGMFSSAVFVCIWLGAIVAVVFNLGLGWPLSGLVVPGYLAPLILTRPWLAFTIFLDSAITYFVSYFISERCGRHRYWHTFLGRERFFLIILVSVIVRLVFDKFAYPIMGEFINHAFSLHFDYRNNLHSFGVVVVALLANFFWGLGFRRSIVPLVSIVFCTVFLIRYVLMVFTNFSIANLSHIYMDIAIYLDATPKSYIILLITAYIASRYNLLYAWSYNGILIPALLALQWYDPKRIIVSLLEAGIIYSIAKGLSRSKLISPENFEGPRRLLLFFTISFIYKMIMIYFFNDIFYLKLHDYLGFGYLLTTLVALRIYDKDPFLRVSRSMLQLLIVSIFLSTLVGYAFTLVPHPVYTATGEKHRLIDNRVVHVDAPLMHYVQNHRVQYYKDRLTKNRIISSKDQKLLLKTLATIFAYKRSKESSLLSEAAQIAAKIDYKVTLIQGKYIDLSGRKGANKLGDYLINLASKSKLGIFLMQDRVPSYLYDFGVHLLEKNNYAFVFSKQADQNQRIPLRNYLYSKNINRSVREYLKGYTFLLLKGDQIANKGKICYIPPSLLEKRPVGTASLTLLGPSHYNNLISNIKNSLPQLKVIVDKNKKEEPVLQVDRCALTYALYSSIFSKYKLLKTTSSSSLTTYFINRGRHLPLEPASGDYIAPTKAQLMYIDQEVLKPLLKFIDHYNGQEPPASQLSILNYLAANAAVFGYQLELYRSHNVDYLILKKNLEMNDKRYWGAYVFRLGRHRQYIVQIPRSYYEKSTLEVGIQLFTHINAFAALVSDTHPFVDVKGDTDVLFNQNLNSLFNLVNQVLLRDTDAEYFPLQIRGFSKHTDLPLPQSDVILAFLSGAWSEGHLNRSQKRLFDYFKAKGYSVELANGSLSTAGYDSVLSAQMKYLRQVSKSDMAVVWLSPTLRSQYQYGGEDKQQLRQFSALNITILNTTILSYLKKALAHNRFARGATLPKKLVSQIVNYINTNNIVILDSLIKDWPGYSYLYVADQNTRRGFLLVKRNNKILAVADLSPQSAQSDNKTVILSPGKGNVALLTQFAEGRAIWLKVKS